MREVSGSDVDPSLVYSPPTPPLTHVPLARSVLDRVAESRHRAETITDALADPNTQILEVYAGEDVRIPVAAVARQEDAEDDDPSWELIYRAPEQGERDERRANALLLIGRDAGGVTYLATSRTEPFGDDVETGDLRQVGAGLSTRDAEVLTTVTGLLAWHASSRFCDRCGQPTRLADAGWLRRCGNGHDHFARTDPAVIMSVRDPDDRILLARGPNWPENRLSTLAGFVEPGESLESAVAREVQEEVGLTITRTAYLGNQPWPFPRSLMIAFHAWVDDTTLHLDENEIVQAAWFSRQDLITAVARGEIRIPPRRLSISRLIIEDWFGRELPEPAIGGW